MRCQTPLSFVVHIEKRPVLRRTPESGFFLTKPNRVDNITNEMKDIETAKLLKIAAYNIYSVTLCAGPPSIRALFNELREPKIGDTVIEITTIRMDSRDPLEGIGTLVSVTDEPRFTRDQAKENGYEDDEEIPTNLIYTITLDFDDGRECRWANASFIKAKTDFIK